ncbi:MAG: hypothetical protein QM731_06925 [Chitinophagaceae bacterium]
MPENDLIDFINLASNQIDEEYFRIQKRAKEDPGSAGDQGEENWATLLREWLPPIFQIVTKGRIIDSKGIVSPQLDIIVLRPEYPKGLLNKKLYLAGGVLAAFECKLTLKGIHLSKFFKNSIIIKGYVPSVFPTVYDTLQSPILYGLLAHSHSWKKSSSNLEMIGEKINETDQQIITTPRQMPDIICIANTGCWLSIKYPLPHTLPTEEGIKQVLLTTYLCQQDDNNFVIKPIASAIKWLLYKLSKEHPGLVSLSQYFNQIIPSSGSGFSRIWPVEQVYTNDNIKLVREINNGNFSQIPNDWKYLALTFY